jgi:F0F1-type ATP synthase assembly protein I
MAADFDPQLKNAQRKQVPGKQDGALHSLVQAEKLIQLALLIPASTMVGWIAGVGLDKLFHQHWIYIAGLLFGATAGFVQMFRTVLQNTKE